MHTYVPVSTCFTLLKFLACVDLPCVKPALPCCNLAVSHARPQEQQAAEPSGGVETAQTRMVPEAFQPGQTVDYNPLQRKVIVTQVMDNREENRSDKGIAAAPAQAIKGGAASGLQQTRSVVTDADGEVGAAGVLCTHSRPWL